MNEKVKSLVSLDLPETTRELIAQIALTGNLAGLTQHQQWDYYRAYCSHLGLDPITRPFDLLTTTERDGQKKTVLYANAGCASQIADQRGVSYSKPEMEFNEQLGVLTVYVAAMLPNGRSRFGEGVADIRSASGRNLENAIKKASTQAHRRATLALCGVAMPDESEVADIPGAEVAEVVASHRVSASLPEVVTAYEEKLSQRVAAYEIEKAAQPEVEAKEKGITVDELREAAMDLESVLRDFGVTVPKLCGTYARIADRPIGKLTELKKAELVKVIEFLESWAADLRSAEE